MKLDELAKKLKIGRMSLHRYRQRPGWPGDGAGLRVLARWIKDHKGRRVSARASAQVPAPGDQTAPDLVGATPQDNAEQSAESSFIVGTQELAELLHISRTSIANWQKSGLPKLPAGANGRSKFDLRQALPWLVLYYKGQIKTAREASGNRLEEARRQNLEADIRDKQQKFDERAGILHPTQDMIRTFAGVLGSFVTAFKPKPSDWAQNLEGKTPDAISRFLDRELDLLFAELNNSPLSQNFIPEVARPHFEACVAAILGQRNPEGHPDNGKRESAGAGSDSAAAGNGDQDERAGAGTDKEPAAVEPAKSSTSKPVNGKHSPADKAD